MRLIAVFLIFILSGMPALAQDRQEILTLEDYSRLFSDSQYKMLAERAVERPRRFSFGDFRLFYAGTTEYRPQAESINRELVTHAYTIQNASDPVELDEALNAYEALVENHLANIAVVTQALSLSRQDERLGDPEFFEWLRAGLLESITGNSSRHPDAYAIATLDEEAYLLNELGVKVISTEIFKAKMMQINIHEVENLNTGERFSIQVEASMPMKWLAQKEQDSAYTLELRRQ